MAGVAWEYCTVMERIGYSEMGRRRVACSVAVYPKLRELLVGSTIFVHGPVAQRLELSTHNR